MRIGYYMSPYRLRDILNLKNWYKEIRDFIHRGKYGWAKSDAWNFDDYLAEVIADGISYLISIDNNVKCGGSTLCSKCYIFKRDEENCQKASEEWISNLKKIVDVCRKYDNDDDLLKFQEVMKNIFVKHFSGLWD